MATVFESIPSAFWAALNNQSLAEMLPPRWSILVNDSGVQVKKNQPPRKSLSLLQKCTLFWESSEAAPPSPPPSPEVTNPHQGALPANIRHKRHATQQVKSLFRHFSLDFELRRCLVFPPHSLNCHHTSQKLAQNFFTIFNFFQKFKN